MYCALWHSAMNWDLTWSHKPRGLWHHHPLRHRYCPVRWSLLGIKTSSCITPNITQYHSIMMHVLFHRWVLWWMFHFFECHTNHRNMQQIAATCSHIHQTSPNVTKWNPNPSMFALFGWCDLSCKQYRKMQCKAPTRWWPLWILNLSASPSLYTWISFCTGQALSWQCLPCVGKLATKCPALPCYTMHQLMYHDN